MNRRERRKARKGKTTQRVLSGSNQSASGIADLLVEAAKLYEAGDVRGAQSTYEMIITMKPTNADALFALGVLVEQKGDSETAKQHYRTAIDSTPDHAPSLVNLGDMLRSERKYSEAIELLERAASVAAEIPLVHNNLGIAFHHSGNTEKAILAFGKALELDPCFSEANCNLGAVFADLERFDEAIDCFETALKQAPENSIFLANLGNALNGLNRCEEAISVLERAVKLDPSNAFAHAKLATLNERLNALDNARKQIAKAKDLDPNNPEIRVMNGIIAGRDKNYKLGIEEISSAIPELYSPNIICRAHFELGHLYDRTKDTYRAFEHYKIGNSLIEEKAVCLGVDRDEYLKEIKQNIEHINIYKNDYLSSTKKNKTNDPIFVVGFPRSGTTLVEQILDSHPKIKTLDEKPIVENTIGYFKQRIGEYPQSISELNDESIAEIKNYFYLKINDFVDISTDDILAYKMPLNIIHAGFIHKIFPNAKFIFIARHPCDACLSCYMQHFTLNRAMTNFTSLQSTADFYAMVIGLWQRYTELLPLQWHTLKYERLVDDFEKAVSEMLNFIGVDWDEAVLAYDKHARGRTVMTPSYSQVTQPIYESSKERWLLYSDQMAPVLPVLEPFINHYDYASSRFSET